MMQPEWALLDTDKTFRRILAVSFLIYVALVILIQFKGESLQMKQSALTTPPQEPPRVARLRVEPQKAPPPPPAPVVEAAKPAPAPPRVESPKVEKPAPLTPPVKSAPKIEKAEQAPPAAAPKAPPQEQVKKVGLLGLLGGSKGSGSPSSVGKGFSSLKEIPPPSSEKKSSSSSSSSSSSFSSSSPSSTTSPPLPSFAQEEIEKIRQRALTEQETRLTQTRHAVVQEDLSQTKITQEGGAGERNQEAISGVVHLNREKLQLLYNRQLQRKPELQGFLTVEFVISSHGQVVECRIVNSSLSDPIFEKEVVQEILRWKFPSAAQGTTTVLYPLSFSPSG